MLPSSGKLLRNWLKQEAIVLIVGVLTLIYSSVGAISYRNATETKVWVLILFSIPCWYVLLSMFTVPRYSWLRLWWAATIATSATLHNASWWTFSLLNSKTGETTLTLDVFEFDVAHRLANANLAWASTMIVALFLVVAKVLGNPTWANGIRSKPFWTICLFLMTFVYVTYSLAFCLALHDRVVRLIGQPPSLTMDGPQALVPSRRSNESHAEFNSWCFANNGRTYETLLYFEGDKSNLTFDRSLLAELELSGQADGVDCTSREKVFRNSCALYEIEKILICQDPESAIQFLAEGRAGGSLLLATARIAAVKNAVQQLKVEFKRTQAYAWPEILWSEAQVVEERTSRSGIYQDPVLRLSMGPITSSSWRTEQRTPSLLDYIYFTVYTVTTTGYGDIKPTDDYSKFVTTIANLYELFFIVIVFNVILSVGRKEQTPTFNRNQGDRETRRRRLRARSS